jgi:hypothetical protein
VIKRKITGQDHNRCDDKMITNKRKIGQETMMMMMMADVTMR